MPLITTTEVFHPPRLVTAAVTSAQRRRQCSVAVRTFLYVRTYLCVRMYVPTNERAYIHTYNPPFPAARDGRGRNPRLPRLQERRKCAPPTRPHHVPGHISLTSRSRPLASPSRPHHIPGHAHQGPCTGVTQAHKRTHAHAHTHAHSPSPSRPLKGRR